jgi:phosphopantetheinyl transferase
MPSRRWREPCDESPAVAPLGHGQRTVLTNVGTHLGKVQSRGAAADIWCAWVEEYTGAVPELSAAVLSAGERARTAQYRNMDAAARYVITRSLVRSVLAGRLNVAPTDVDVRVTDLGKPVLSEHLHFNVSHSGDLITLAVSEDRAVGIDIERRREVQRATALIARWLTDAEQREVGELHAGGASESDAFLRVWSAKEARLKALGVGISGANAADVSRVSAVALDDLFDRTGTRGYVGAVAFA